jgi:hypothetical protein
MMKINKFKKIKIIMLFFFLFTLDTAIAKKEIVMDNFLQKDYIIDLFDAEVLSKESIYFFLIKNNYFKFKNQIFLWKVQDKYEITFFLDENKFKEGDRIYVFGKGITIYESNLQNIKLGKNFYFKEIQKNTYSIEYLDGYSKLNLFIKSDYDLCELFSKNSIFLTNNLSYTKLIDKEGISSLDIRNYSANIKTFDKRIFKISNKSICLTQNKFRFLYSNKYTSIIYFFASFLLIFYFKELSEVSKIFKGLEIVLIFLTIFIITQVFNKDLTIEAFNQSKIQAELLTFLSLLYLIIIKKYEIYKKKLLFGIIFFVYLLFVYELSLYKIMLEIFSIILILSILCFVIKNK